MMYSMPWVYLLLMLVLSIGGLLMRRLFALLKDNKAALEKAIIDRFDRIEAADMAQTKEIRVMGEKLHAFEVSTVNQQARAAEKYVRREDHVSALSSVQISLHNLSNKMDRIYERGYERDAA